MSTQTCPDESVLSQLLLGKLTGEQQNTIEAHLETCPECAAKADTMETDDEFVSEFRRLSSVASDVHEIIGSDATRIQNVLDTVQRSMTSEETVWGNETKAEPVDPSKVFARKLSSSAELEFLATAHSSDELGRLGHYRVLEVLGSGGMGVVYRAEDPALKRLVALKAMKPAIAADPEAKQRFLKEAEATAAIEHDNIVTIYQVGEDRGIPFFAMQFLKGESLGQRADRLGRLPQQEVVRIGREIAEGLSAAHARGLIHRDIKPDNIWLQEGTDRVRIVDFGLVRSFEEDAGLTQSGTVLGTPKYMAPEQARGESVDHRCDLFSLGCVLYRLLAGKAPFEGSNLTATLIAVTQNEAAPIESLVPDINPSLCKLISKLLTKQREGRPESAREVADALKRIESELAATATSAPETSTSKTSPEHKKSTETATHVKTQPGQSRRPPRNRILIAALGGFAAIILLSVLLIKLRTKDGLVIIELQTEQPIAQVEIDGTTVQFKQDPAGKTLSLSVPEGKHSLTLKTAEGLSLTTDLGSKPVEVAVNDKTVVRAWLESVHNGEMNLSPRSENSPPATTELWPPGPEPAWASYRRFGIDTGDVLPGIVERPATLGGLPRWNVDTIQARGPLRSIRYSPDGKWVATGSRDGHVRIYNAASMQLHMLLPGTSIGSGIADMAWHPNSVRLAVASDNNYSLKIWTVDGQLVCDQQSHYFSVNWCKDGKYLLCGGYDNLDLRTEDGSLHKVLVESGSERAVCGCGNIASSPLTPMFACLHTDGFLRFWNPETGAEEESRAIKVRGDYRGYGVRWSTKDRIAVQTKTGVALIQPDKAEVIDLGSSPCALAWHPDGDRLVYWNGISAWTVDVSTSTLKETDAPIEVGSLIGPYPTAIDYSPTGDRVAFGGGGLSVYDVAAKNFVMESSATSFTVVSVAASLDGQFIACVSEGVDKGIHLLRPDGKKHRTLQFDPSQLRYAPAHLAWNPGGRFLAANGDLSGLLLCDVTNGSVRRIGELVGASAAWSPDGQLLAAGMKDGVVWIVDLKGRIIQELQIPEPGFVYLAWSSQGALMARANDNIYSIGNDSGEFKTVYLTKLPAGTENLIPRWEPNGQFIDFARDVRLNKEGQSITAANNAAFPSDWNPKTQLFVSRVGTAPRICSPDGSSKLERRDNGESWRAVAAWNPITDQIYLGYDESLVRAVSPKDLDVTWTALMLPDGGSLTVSSAGQVIDAQRKDFENRLVYFTADQQGTIQILTASDFELAIGQEILTIPNRYFDKEYRFAIELNDKWNSVASEQFTVPGISRAAFARPGGVSLNLFIQETGATIDPAWMLAESARAQEEKLSATVLEKEVREIAGLDAMWMVVEGMGTGSAIDGKGPVKTTQHWVAIPRESDVVVALLTSPSGTFAANQKLFAEVLATLKLGKAKSSM